MTNSDDLFAKLQALSPDERAKALAMLQSQSGGVNLGQGNAIGQMGDANAGSVALSDDARINGVAVGVNLGRIVYGRDPAEDERRRLVWYLTRLANKLYRLPLRGVEERLDQGEGVALPQVYVMLATTTYKLLDETEYTPLPLQHYFQEDVKAVFDSFELFEEYGGGWSEIFGAAQTDYDEEFALPNRAVLAYNFENSTGIRYYSVERAMLATEVLNHDSSAILLGGPGSGKSTFVRHLAWALARRGLDQFSDDTALWGWSDQRRLLPILLPLRALSGRLAKDGMSAATVYAALRDEMHSLCLDKVDDLLNESLHRGKALLLFDGLDEVPLEATVGTSVDRQTTLEAIRLFTEMHDRVSAVVTCRKRAFDDSLNQQLGWQVETIAPFTLGQVRHFVPAWYNELARQGQIDHQRAEQLTKTLIDTIVGSERLREMAKTPLLLTMMALVLYNRGELPRDRPQLYERILELLLGQWDKVRDGQSLAEAIGLPEWGSERLRPFFDRLSYDAHLRGSSDDGRGRLKRGELYTGLIDFFKTARVPNYADAALRCLDYFEQRSGLLLPDESDSYAFAHLTLQEHCAGRHMMHDREAATLVMQHRGDDRWREPIMLGLGVVQQTKPELIDRVLADLIDADESGKPKEAARRQRDLVFAAEIGKDRDWNYLRTQHVNVDRLQRDLRRGLVELLEDKSQPLPTVERVRAAELLGELGDPRFPVTLDQWRAELGKRNERFGEPNGYWCYVKPGTYRIGGWEEVEPHADIELPGFWIARFPITVAQFAPFVEVGYENEAERWWTPEGWSWLQETDRTYPKALDYHQYNKFNQPIVSLTWYEALTYAKWLDAQLSNLLPDGFMIRLPNEAEWETAAAYDNNFIRNVYPWGDDEPTTERAIYKASNLDRPAPVGCCPSGLAKCGALDLAGNVLEWIVGEWYKYPTASDQGVRDFTPNDYEVPLRGGEFNSNSSYIRCGERERLNPLNARFSSGFRLVLAPRLPQ